MNDSLAGMSAAKRTQKITKAATAKVDTAPDTGPETAQLVEGPEQKPVIGKKP